MKFYSDDQPLSESAARNCLLVNQLATPGLGSLIAGRWISGIGQLLLAIAGFILVLLWFVLTLKQAYTLMDSNAEPVSHARIGLGGAALFGAAWFWALGTSIQLMRAAKRNGPLPPVVPPPIPPATKP